MWELHENPPCAAYRIFAPTTLSGLLQKRDKMDLINAWATKLVEAERERKPIDPISATETLTEAESYQIQHERQKISGGSLTGYKLGFTSRVMREQMGIDRPNYGQLSERMELLNTTLDMSTLIHPRIEPEIAVIVDQDIEGAEVTLAEVQRAVTWAFPAIEIVDSRFKEYRFRAEDNTADNSSAARYVLGPPVSRRGLDLRLVGVLVSRNGQALGTGIGAEALGDPLLSVRWLARKLAEQGRILKAGSIVLTGGLTRAEQVSVGDHIFAEFGGLGYVSLHCDGPRYQTEA